MYTKDLDGAASCVLHLYCERELIIPARMYMYIHCLNFLFKRKCKFIKHTNYPDGSTVFNGKQVRQSHGLLHHHADSTLLHVRNKISLF